MPYGYCILSVKSALFPGKLHAVVLYQTPEGVATVVWNPNPQDPRGVGIPVEDWVEIDVLAVIDPSKLLAAAEEKRITARAQMTFTCALCPASHKDLKDFWEHVAEHNAQAALRRDDEARAAETEARRQANT